MKRFTACFLSILFLFITQNLHAEIAYVDINGNSYTENSDSYHDYGNAFSEPGDANYHTSRNHVYHRYHSEYHASLPATIPAQGEPVIIVNPNVHAWGAYSAAGKLLRSGLATAGSSYCRDLDRACKTKAGVFRINSLGSEDCISKKFPLGEGGAPMPYCMFFNGGQGIHGSHELAYANISHGCVRVSVSDARWLRFHFSRINTKVIIKPY
ncbi:MAG: L,D-transpeptidase [Gammaproteobacteria bacterium]|nr:L,D-transpeptidase [Gammaproteobacteria bacterium]